MSFLEELLKRRLFFDGAMGTMLQTAGLMPGQLPESFNITNPNVVINIHEKYIKAGCNIIKTNTFGANPIKLENSGYTCEQLFESGVKLARQAIRNCGEDVFVAADIGPVGKLLMPLGELSFDEAYEGFSRMAAAGEKSGADLILIETMGDIYEIKAAILAAKEKTSLPIVVTFTADENGKLFTGAPVEAAAIMAESLGVAAIGLNCGVGPAQMLEIGRRMAKCTCLPLVFNPNAGMPCADCDGHTYYNVTPDEFADYMVKLSDIASVAGGCCGTTPEYIGKMIEKCNCLPKCDARSLQKTFVSSGSEFLEIGNGAVIVGERINPTGKSKFKQALRENDINYILNEGIMQKNNGAHILDVNVGLPEIDEAGMLHKAVVSLQSVVSLPLQLDTSNAQALERGMRYVNGKPLINSVNGKKESMDTVFPLVKKYGGCVVALTLDENGIPETAEGRVAIAKKIIAEAQKYGIKKNDIIVDVLSMAISAGMSAEVTLSALREIKNMGVCTILGVSNISFGLPERENINSAFFAMCLDAGLDVAIINPNSEKMMSVYYSSMVLLGHDAACNNYIEKFSQPKEMPLKKNENTGVINSLKEAIERGLCDIAAEQAKKELENTEPMSVVENILIPALDKVGSDFEKGIVFLPSLLMSASAAQAAFEKIKKHIEKSGKTPEKHGKIVLATVKGDIHDIGKNIVRVLLDNYGFDVTDLGKDVPSEKIVEAAIKEKAQIVGLSALMTTTVPFMAETIALLKEKYPQCKTVVGGAVLTEEYAKRIGADKYAPDAMTTVNFAREIIK